MRLEGHFPQQEVEGKLALLDARGEEVDVAKIFDSEGRPITIVGFSWTPLYFRSNAKPVSLYLQSRDKKGGIVQRSVVTLSGMRGRAALFDRTAPVEPQFETGKVHSTRGRGRPKSAVDADSPSNAAK
jgi:hypothetical protein